MDSPLKHTRNDRWFDRSVLRSQGSLSSARFIFLDPSFADVCRMIPDRPVHLQVKVSTVCYFVHTKIETSDGSGVARLPIWQPRMGAVVPFVLSHNTGISLVVIAVDYIV